MPLLAENAIWAWVNFNGFGTVSIRDSFRVSSITDNGIGSYQVNLSSSAGNAASVLVGGFEDTTDQQGGIAFLTQRSTVYSANAHRIRGYSPLANNSWDFLHICSITMKS